MPHWRPEMGLSTKILSWAPDEELRHVAFEMEALTKTHLNTKCCAAPWMQP